MYIYIHIGLGDAYTCRCVTMKSSYIYSQRKNIYVLGKCVGKIYSHVAGGHRNGQSLFWITAGQGNMYKSLKCAYHLTL